MRNEFVIFDDGRLFLVGAPVDPASLKFSDPLEPGSVVLRVPSTEFAKAIKQLSERCRDVSAIGLQAAFEITYHFALTALWNYRMMAHAPGLLPEERESLYQSQLEFERLAYALRVMFPGVAEKVEKILEDDLEEIA